MHEVQAGDKSGTFRVRRGGGLQVKRPLETLRGRREDNIKMYFQVIGWCVGE